jgi:hypothetical protein
MSLHLDLVESDDEPDTAPTGRTPEPEPEPERVHAVQAAVVPRALSTGQRRGTRPLASRVDVGDASHEEGELYARKARWGGQNSLLEGLQMQAYSGAGVAERGTAYKGACATQVSIARRCRSSSA